MRGILLLNWLVERDGQGRSLLNSLTNRTTELTRKDELLVKGWVDRGRCDTKPELAVN